jgi:hypothetical protein
VNSLERLYIDRLNTFTGKNPFGWNRSMGGEGGLRYNRPFALKKDCKTHFGTDLYLFLMQHPEIDPEHVVALLEGQIQNWNGWEVA